MNMHEFLANLVPYPRIKVFTASLAPLNHIDSPTSTVSSHQIFKEISNDSNVLLSTYLDSIYT